MGDIDRLAEDLRRLGSGGAEGLAGRTGRVLRDNARLVESRARAHVRSRTGELAASITAEVDGLELSVGSHLPQARVVEEGGPRNKPQRYLQQAVDDTEKRIAEAVADAVTGGLDG